MELITLIVAVVFGLTAFGPSLAPKYLSNELWTTLNALAGLAFILVIILGALTSGN